MKVKIMDAVEFINVYPLIKDTKLKFGTLYKLSKYIDACNKEREFYVENLNKIFDKYGEKDESGALIFFTVFVEDFIKIFYKYGEKDEGAALKLTDDKSGIIIKEDQRDECNKELEDLMTIEVDIPADPLRIEELESLELDLSTYSRIKPFIEE